MKMKNSPQSLHSNDPAVDDEEHLGEETSCDSFYSGKWRTKKNYAAPHQQFDTSARFSLLHNSFQWNGGGILMPHVSLSISISISISIE